MGLSPIAQAGGSSNPTSAALPLEDLSLPPAYALQQASPSVETHIARHHEHSNNTSTASHLATSLPPSVQPQPQPSPAISVSSVHSTTSSIRDFHYPSSSPLHSVPPPTSAPPLHFDRYNSRNASRSSHADPDALPPPAFSDSEQPPNYTRGERCRRYPTVFASEDDYLKALSKWAEGKKFMERPRDASGVDVGVEGFYGGMSGEDYVRRGSAMTEKQGKRRGQGRQSRVGQEELSRTTTTVEGTGPRNTGEGKENGGIKKKSFANWVKRKTQAT